MCFCLFVLKKVNMLCFFLKDHQYYILSIISLYDLKNHRTHFEERKPGKDQLSLKSKTDKNKRGFINITKASYIDTDDCKVDYTNISVISNSL